MSLDAFNIVRPGQNLGTGDVDANHYPEFTGAVEETIERVAKFHPYVDIRNVQGTSVISGDAIGESTLGVLVPGVTPNQTSPNQFNQISLHIDTVVLARTTYPLLDVFQKKYDVRVATGREHGKKISKLFDQSFAIMAAKAGMATSSAYGALPGHAGGSQVSLATADRLNPAVLLSKIGDLLAQMEEKDVDPQADGIVIAVRPDVFYALQDAEQIVNGEYVTAQGATVARAKMLKAYDVPVISSNNQPNAAITGHPLSNTKNGNAYDGDFTDLVATAFAPHALLAGQTIPLTTKVFFDDVSKHWFVDAYLSWAVRDNRREYSGVILQA